jgi:ribosomal protein S18 acetylase RimI-like enzyme
MEKSIKQSLEGKSTQYFAFQRLSDVEEVVIGTILVTPTYRDQEGNVLPGEGYVGNFSVDPKIQSKGIGGKLMRAAMDQLKEENFSHCVIWVFENRVELIDWYKKLGFEDTLELVAWDIPTDSNLILDVKFAVMKLKL